MKLIYPHKFKIPKKLELEFEEYDLKVSGHGLYMIMEDLILEACKYTGTLRLSGVGDPFILRYIDGKQA